MRELNKGLIAAAIASLLSIKGQAQFTAGNVVVYEVNISTLTSSASAVLREYSPIGTTGIVISVPTTGTARLTNTAGSTFEGSLTRSPNGRHLLFAGFDAPTGLTLIETSSSTTYNRVVDTVNILGVIGRVAATTAYNGVGVFSATRSGNNVWTGGNTPLTSQGGLRYLGSAQAESNIINELTREVKVINGVLYSVTLTTFQQVGTSLPTSPSTPTVLYSNTLGAFTGFAINPSGNIAYISDLLGGIYKITKTGSTWSLAYGIAAGSVRHLAVDWGSAGSNGNGAVIYYTTATAVSELRKLTDDGTTTPTSTLLATAATNRAFRGVSLAPVEPCTPTVTIQSNDADNSICIGMSVTFSVATSSNLGSSPAYQWNLNGSAVSGATNATYTTTALANNDVVTLTVSSNAPCIVNGNTVTSTGVTTAVLPLVTPAVSIQSNDADNSICQNSSITFSIASSGNLGAAPAYQWRLNGNSISGATNAMYTTSALTNTDVISLAATSNAACPSTPTVISSGIAITVIPTVTPTVAIHSNDGDNSICQGSSIIFSIASATNLGNAPTYQWRLNSNPVAGATNTTYTATGLADNDVISLVATSSAACPTIPNAISAGITVAVIPNGTPAVTIQSSDADNSICQGTPVTFSITTSANLGASPLYQWRRNGNPVSGATNATYTTSTLADDDVTALSATSNATCIAGSGTVVSAGITTDVINNLTPSVTINVPSPICLNTPATFTLGISNLGSAPVYQWYFNGSPVSSTASYTAPRIDAEDQDTLTVTVSNINTVCATETTLSRTEMLLSTPNPDATTIYTSSSGTTRLCEGDMITFTSKASLSPYSTGATYQWFRNGSTIAGESNANYITSQPGDISVKATYATGCTRTSASRTVNVRPVAEITPQGPTAICTGASVVLEATIFPGANYYWKQDSIDRGNDITQIAKTSGNYFLIVTKDRCYDTSATVNVNVLANPGISVTTSGPTDICTGGSVTLQAESNPNYNYEWLKNNDPIPGATGSSIIVNATAAYRPSISNGGCPAKLGQTIRVKQITTPTATITTLSSQPSYRLLRATIGSDLTYQWYRNGVAIAGATNRNDTATLNGNYTVVVSRTGCSDSTVVPITVALTNPGSGARAVASMPEQTILVYPNPSEGVFNISSQNPVNIIVRDVEGRSIREAKSTTVIDLTGTTSGVYFLTITDTEGKVLQIQRITKQ